MDRSRFFFTNTLFALLLLAMGCRVDQGNIVTLAEDASLQTIYGTITDGDTSLPLIANVEVEGTMKGAASDVEGFFLISGLAAGSHMLRITRPDYDPVDVPIDVREGERNEFEFVMRRSDGNIMEAVVEL